MIAAPILILSIILLDQVFLHVRNTLLYRYKWISRTDILLNEEVIQTSFLRLCKYPLEIYRAITDLGDLLISRFIHVFDVPQWETSRMSVE